MPGKPENSEHHTDRLRVRFGVTIPSGCPGCPGCPECPALTKYYGCVKASGSDFGVARAFPASPFSFERHSATNRLNYHSYHYLCRRLHLFRVQRAPATWRILWPNASQSFTFSRKSKALSRMPRHMSGDVWWLQYWQSIIHTQGTFFPNQRSCGKL